MARTTQTLDDTHGDSDETVDNGPPLPGLVVIFLAGRPALVAFPLKDGQRTIGRDSDGGLFGEDARLSRQHAVISYADGRWTVRDLQSRNGTVLDGERVEGARTVAATRAVVRAGDTVVLLLADVRRFLGARIERRDGIILGPTLQSSWDQVAQAARAGLTVHLTGESGSGKELAARHFHDSGPRKTGRFVAINCAAVPATLAERLFFGAKRGVYSGADADADGYVQAADGGTLFLDEVGDLDAGVQAKLLRLLETHEVLPLGAARPRKVEFGLCSATHASLQGGVASGKFRADLFFRIGRPMVVIPPLRDRLEEIPHIVAEVLGPQVRAHVTLIDALVRRRWPGNVRELVAEVKTAAQCAAEEGASAVKASHLAPEEPSAAALGVPSGVPTGPRHESGPVRASPRDFTKDELVAALAQNGGNVSATARALGLHRTQLRRLLERYDIEPGPVTGPHDLPGGAGPGEDP